MENKYIGSRPVKISKATTKVGQIDIGERKARELDTKKKAHTVGNKVRRNPVIELNVHVLTLSQLIGERSCRLVWYLETVYPTLEPLHAMFSA